MLGSQPKLSINDLCNQEGTEHPEQPQQQAFISRMSNLPIIHSLGSAYEATKNASRVVKVGFLSHV